MEGQRPLRGLRVQSPSLTPNKNRAPGPSTSGKPRQVRRDLIAILHDAGVPRKNVNPAADQIERLHEAMAEIERHVVADLIRGWL